MPFFLTIILMAYDGAPIGASLAVLAGTLWVKYVASSSTLRDVRNTPSARVSDLVSLLKDHYDRDMDGMLVFLRGQIQLKPSRIPAWLGLNNYGALFSQRTGEPAVLVRHLDTCQYDGLGVHREFRGSAKSVPFGLVDGQHNSAYVHVNLDGSSQPLPLKVYDHLHRWQSPSPYSFGQMCPIIVSAKESILPIGKEISAIGICKTRYGAPYIRACRRLPYFLSDMTRDEIEADIFRHTKSLFWSSIVFGALSVSFFGYAIFRNWQRWKKVKRSQHQGSREEETLELISELVDVP